MSALKDSEWLDLYREAFVKYVAYEMEGAIQSTSKCGKFNTFTSKPDRKGCCNKFMIEWLETHLKQSKKGYYDKGEPTMSDDIFDKFEARLRCLKPDSEVLGHVGTYL